MLFRLELRGVDVKARWVEIADKAEERIGDCLSPFTLPHWMMALAATRRFEAGGRMLEAMRKYAAGTTINARMVRDYAMPISEALLLRARGDPAAACRVMRPAIGGMYRLGGSHAQQDVLEQLFLDCAVAAGTNDDVTLILERVAGRHPVPPDTPHGLQARGERAFLVPRSVFSRSATPSATAAAGRVHAGWRFHRATSSLRCSSFPISKGGGLGVSPKRVTGRQPCSRQGPTRT